MSNLISLNSMKILLPLTVAISMSIPVAFAAAAITEHQDIVAWEGTSTCLQCHETEAQEVFGSTHYQWLGETPYMQDGPEIQGKLDIGVNSYCINITGNWNGCGSCHVGLGDRPSLQLSNAQLENIDCLICHQESYQRVKIDGRFVPDTDNMTISILEAAQTVHIPTRVTCLKCHAKGGGGDNYKRGDLAIAHGTTTDRNFDVHMASSGANLDCQACHTTEQHLMAGRGTDLRPTDLDVTMSCTDCHEDKGLISGHGQSAIGRHVMRVACQSCHISTYARNANDTLASEQTEVHRDWRLPHTKASGAIHPTPTLAGDLIPQYAWWDGTSTSYLLYEDALIDQATGAIATSRPVGEATGANSKLYPFKYKTATQPLVQNYNQLIALDTSVYFSTGDADAAIRAGLENMNFSPEEPYEWVQTDTLQLITHEVTPVSAALTCTDCHTNTTRMDLTGNLGYQLKDARSVVCHQCHGPKDGEDRPEYLWIHDEHVRGEGYDCSWCHTFSRPERGLQLTPIIAQLEDLIRTLRVLVGFPVTPSQSVQDINGDNHLGLEEAIDILRDISNN